MKEDALKLAALGWPILPLTGKRPLTRHGVKDASTDPAVITDWLERWPDANIGVATGGSLLVVDIDPRHGGNESLDSLPAMPATRTARTGGGGRHYYFANPGELGNRSNIKPGIDIRCEGGYVVAPPSRTESDYVWECETELAEIPAWLLELIKPPVATAPATVAVAGDAEAALSALRKIKMTDKGDGSKRLFAYACRSREFNLSAEQFIATIRLLELERPFPKRWSNDELVRRWTAAAGKVEIGSALAQCDLWNKENRTDAANASYFVEQFAQDFRWCDPWSTWLFYDGYWQPDHRLNIEAAAKRCGQSRWAQVAKICGNAKAGEQLKKEVLAFAKYCNSASGLANVVRLARSKLTVLPKQLDTNPYLLNCSNGTLDLRTGVLRSHDRSDFITRIIEVEYDPKADCPTFCQFVTGLFDGQDLVDFIQKLLGYSLTGDVSEQVLAIFYGNGSNGKSTLLTLLLNLLNDYGAKAPERLLTAKKFDSHPTEIAKLFGKRLVVANETENGAAFSEARVKDLTGGDKLTARRMGEDFWDFEPTHKLIVGSNYKPSVEGTDDGIWRRLRLVPFVKRFWNRSKGESGPPELEADPSLPEKLKIEYPGILRWLVEGCLKWQREGLGVPAEIASATQQYRQEEDSVAAFLEQCCTVGPDLTVSVAELFEAYREFTDENDLKQVKFSRFMGQKGFKKQKKTTGERRNEWFWGGLSMKLEQVVSS